MFVCVCFSLFSLIPYPVDNVNISLSCHLFDGLPKSFLPLASYGLVSFEMFFFIHKYNICIFTEQIQKVHEN